VKFSPTLLLRYCLAIGLLSQVVIPAQAQVELIVNQIPENTPAADTIFIVGSFNQWNPSDHRHYLSPRKDGTLGLVFEVEENYFEFKFHRGDWNSVEGSELGEPMANRPFIREGAGLTSQTLQIKSWEDQERYKITVQALPGPTPHDAAIYVTGDFNNWNPAAPNYQLTPNPDGTYSITINPTSDTIRYLFTRGNWESVETSASGRTLPHHMANPGLFPDRTVYHTVEGWKDLNHTPVDPFTLLLAVAAALGVLLLLLINTEPTGRFKANTFFAPLLIVFTLCLFSKLFLRIWDLFDVFPNLTLIQDFFVFLIAPILLIYLRKLISPAYRIGLRGVLFFGPVILQFIFYIPFLALTPDELTSRLVNGSMDTFYMGLAIIALVHNGIYAYHIIRLVSRDAPKLNDTQSEDDYLSVVSYTNALVFLFVTIQLIGFATVMVELFGVFTPQDTRGITRIGVDMIWVVFAGYPFLISYFVVGHPQLFRPVWSGDVITPEQEPASKPVPPALKQSLIDLMRTNKPYLNPKLTLSELAQLLHTNSHELSHAINEGFQVNFFDFVNSYRIEAFKAKLKDPTFKNHTVLAMALESGFSSKTTFNRAFKKATGTTPRDYQAELEG